MILRSIFSLAAANLLCGCGTAQRQDSSPSAQAQQDSEDNAVIPEELRHLPRPDPKLADRIDATLSANRCVGGIGKWERTYSFRDSDAAGRKLVDFVLFEADGTTIKAGRVLLPPGGRTDDRRGRIVTGSYNVRTARADIEACGVQN